MRTERGFGHYYSLNDFSTKKKERPPRTLRTAYSKQHIDQ